MESMGLKVDTPMIPEMDNKGAVDLINSFSVGGRTRHIDVKQCFLRKLKESKQLIVKWIPGTQNVHQNFDDSNYNTCNYTRKDSHQRYSLSAVHFKVISILRNIPVFLSQVRTRRVL